MPIHHDKKIVCSEHKYKICQAVLAASLTLVSVGALLLERLKKNDDRMFLYARSAAAAALVIGTANALLI